MDIEIRDIKLEEIKDAVDIKITGRQNAYRGILDDKDLDNLPNTRESNIERWTKNINDGHFIVAIYNGEVVGFSRFVDDNSHSKNIDCDCELCAIYVKPKYKFMGIGTKLFNYVTNHFKSLNKEKMILWCLDGNLPSIKFYTKMGGTIVSEKYATIDNKKYKELGFLYNLKED